jgi:aminoglycoside phosphotransferase (APT) family kinase protein
MAEPLGFDDRLRTRFERTVAGRRSDAESILGRSIPLRRLCNELGGLHALSDAGVTLPLGRLGSGAILGRIERTVTGRLRSAFPNVGDELSAYVQSLRTAAGELPSSADVTLHGDLHGGNLILDEDGPVLVGLDSLACGDPAFDLALLGSSLFLAALERNASVARVATTIEELPWIYTEVTGTTILGDAYAWYLAAALVGWQADAALQVLAPRADVLYTTLLDTAMTVLRDGANATSMTSFAD